MEYLGQRKAIGIIDDLANINAAGLDIHEEDWWITTQEIQRIQDSIVGIKIHESAWQFHREGWRYKSIRIEHHISEIAHEACQKIEDAIEFAEAEKILKKEDGWR